MLGYDSSDSSADEEDARLRPIRNNRNAPRLIRIIDASDKPDGFGSFQSRTVTNEEVTTRGDILSGLVLHSRNLKQYLLRTPQLPIKISQSLLVGLQLIMIFQNDNDCHASFEPEDKNSDLPKEKVIKLV